MTADVDGVEMMWKRATVMATDDPSGRLTWQWMGIPLRVLGAVGHQDSVLRA